MIEDAREDSRVRGNLAIGDLGVIGYAGVPLIDEDGEILGSLCAISHNAKSWVAEDIELLLGLVPTVRRFLASSPA